MLKLADGGIISDDDIKCYIAKVDEIERHFIYNKYIKPCNRYKRIYKRTKNRRIKRKQLKKDPMLCLEYDFKHIIMDAIDHSFNVPIGVTIYDKWYDKYRKNKKGNNDETLA